jgi:hypothetical protein
MFIVTAVKTFNLTERLEFRIVSSLHIRRHRRLQRFLSVREWDLSLERRYGNIYLRVYWNGSSQAVGHFPLVQLVALFDDVSIIIIIISPHRNQFHKTFPAFKFNIFINVALCWYIFSSMLHSVDIRAYWGWSRYVIMLANYINKIFVCLTFLRAFWVQALWEYFLALCTNTSGKVTSTAAVVYWSEFLATHPEVPGSIPDATRFSE